MGKVTTRTSSHRYRLNEKQKVRYNKYHAYLTPEIRNKYDTKTSTLTDIYSLGVVFNYVACEDSFLECISRKMVDENPNFRPNTYEILKSFGH